MAFNSSFVAYLAIAWSMINIPALKHISIEYSHPQYDTKMNSSRTKDQSPEYHVQ
jgi:hypothetical protein